jgi:hypothetical protein
MVPLDAFAGRSIFQLAFVVQNLEDALERYSAALGAAPWRSWTLGAVEHEDTEYRGAITSVPSCSGRHLLCCQRATPDGLRLRSVPRPARPWVGRRWIAECGREPDRVVAAKRPHASEYESLG